MHRPPDEIVAVLRDAERILIATHVYPDGDALGSQLALADSLRRAGRYVVVFAEEPVSHLYDFLPGSKQVQTTFPNPDDFDCAVAVDCGDSQRLGRMEGRLLAIHPFIAIDHHGGHRDFGDLRWIDAERSATGEMVYDLIDALGLDLSDEGAFCLYTAIVSDTGSFKYASTSARTLAIASDLVSRGVRPEVVAGRLYDNFTVSRLELLKRVLATLELHEQGRLAMISVTRQMFDETGATEEDTENFINYPRALADVRVAAFLKETRDGRVAVSLRSKEAIHDVSVIARSFGGGGHRNAAGFRLASTSLDAVRGVLLDALRPVVAR